MPYPANSYHRRSNIYRRPNHTNGTITDHITTTPTAAQVTKLPNDTGYPNTWHITTVPAETLIKKIRISMPSASPCVRSDCTFEKNPRKTSATPATIPNAAQKTPNGKIEILSKNIPAVRAVVYRARTGIFHHQHAKTTKNNGG